MKLTFSDKLDPDLIDSVLTNDTFKVRVKQYEETIPVAFNWTIVKFYRTYAIVQLVFDEPFLVSQGD